MSFEVLQAVVVSAVSWVLWKYFRQFFVSSSLDNIPGPAAGSWVYGNLKQVLNKNGWDFIQDLTDNYPGIVKLHGPLGHRMLYVFEPNALHHIVVKDQHIYEEATWFIKFNHLRFGPGLLGTLGDHHRKQRKMLNPVFSINHMRRMIPMFDNVSRKLQKGVENLVSGHDGPVEVDMLLWMGRTALELIGQAGLGYSFDPLVSDSPDEFMLAIKSFGYIGTPAFRARLVDLFPHEGVQGVKRFIDIMHRRSIEIYREKVMKVGEGKDIMSILMRVNMAADEQDRMPEKEVIAQISTFIFAAMDTTSNALSITLMLLTERPDVQQKLREEILGTFDDEDNFDYDKLVALPYLDAVCRETLRLHAPVTQVFREARQDIILPLSEPIKGVDGKMIHEILVPKDTTIGIGILSANRSKAIWGEDAMAWKPERWLAPLPESVSKAKIPGIYSNLMTFIGGDDLHFSQLEMKIVLCLLLAKFTFAPSGKTITWNLSNVRFPTVGNNPKPSMPMMVGLYEGKGHA
ncbi:hypothetical protein V8D89_002696 [Ganoderma adspersum]